MEGRIRERLQDLATDAPSGQSAAPILVRRARRRVARNIAVGTLALGLLAFGLVAGMRTFTNSTSQPAGRPPGPAGSHGANVSSSPVSVPATQAFTDTGIRISQGEVFSVTATGIASHRPGFTVGPQGVAFNEGTCAKAQSGSTFTAPGLRCWSLIGRIGTSGVIFYVGPSFHLEAPFAGELFLGFNDSYDRDNSGAFSATISAAR